MGTTARDGKLSVMGRMGLLIAMSLALAGLLLGAAVPASAQDSAPDAATTPRARPHIVVHPRSYEPGPNAKRYCRAWLAKEYRPSGTVITPQMRCWWED